MSARTHVVIVGGGFGGLKAAQSLARRRDVLVTLIDKRNHHLFQPLLYQVATAGLAPSDIAEPIRSILSRQRNVTVRLAEVTDVDLTNKRLHLKPTKGDSSQSQWLEYDKLILATGVKHSYFGRPEWEQHAPGLKSIGDALEIRRRMLLAFEQAEFEPDEARRRAKMTFVVVGGGPTGVEVAGAIAEIALQTLRRDFRNIDTREARVLLVEAGPAVLSVYPERLQQSALKQLKDIGVEVRLGQLVTGVDAGGVTVGEERIEAGTIVWAAGIEAQNVTDPEQVKRDQYGRIVVDPQCRIPNHPDVYAIGDLAHFDHNGQPLPGLAPVALQMGAYVGKHIHNPDAPAFKYSDKGSMATIGRSKAVVDSVIPMTGFTAWLAWVFIHLMVLVTFRNRTLVFMKWSWAWLTYERASRLVWQNEDSATQVNEVDRVA